MKKTYKRSQNSPQRNLIETPTVIDFFQLFSQSTLSENEQGIVKRRLIENREQFGNILQLLLQQADKEKRTIDIHQSLKNLEEDEGREIRSFDSIAKILTRDFPELLQFILTEYQVEANKTRALVGKEFVFIKRIADVIFETKDNQGNEVIIHLEFEREYQSDEQMDKRKLEYRHLMEMDADYEGKVVLCNVFYLRGSPVDKEMIEEREVKLPTKDPRYSGELKYKAYHLSLVTIETIIQRNLPFLLPFVVESELRIIDKDSTATNHIVSLQKQIDSHEPELTNLIESLTAEKMESLRTTIEYLWGKSYSKQVFNKSTLLKLMREQLNLRQADVRWGQREGIAKRKAEELAVTKQMVQEGEITQEQMEKLMNRLEKFRKDEQ
jgi:hypothetical protein